MLRNAESNRAFFVLERAAAHQNWAGSGMVEAGPKAIDDHGRGWWRHIKFQIAGHHHFRFGCADFDEALAVFFGLRQETIDAIESAFL